MKSRPEVSSTGFALALILLALTGSYAVAEKVRSWRDGADVMGFQKSWVVLFGTGTPYPPGN